MKQEFKANKGKFWIYIVLSIVFPIVIHLFNFEGFHNFWFLIPSILPLVLFLWIYFSTKYVINDHYFYYQSAFLKGKIDIDNIKKVQTNTTLWSGVKPALATKGIIITFGYDDVYVAPVNNQNLINAFLKINPNIIVE